MKNEIKIGDKRVVLIANALTPFAYTEVFKKDFLRTLMSFKTLEGKNPAEYTAEELAFIVGRTTSFAEIAFIMSQQGEGKTAAELVELTRGDFLEWLTGFEPNAFTDAAVISDILKTWQGQAVGAIESKNA